MSFLHDRPDRRTLFRILAGAALTPLAAHLAACQHGTGADDTGPDAAASADADDATCAAVPAETGGPYPGDGSNGPNALAIDGVVRSDIRSSFGSASAVAAGVPLQVTLRLVGAAGCAPLAGYAVYLWHCDRDGNYSMYSSAVVGENYLRGVQAAVDDGTLTFQTIFPGCYAGRWPHIHFEVYESVAAATGGANPVHTSQLALPASTCDAVYATSGYSASATNLQGVSLDSDMVFADGADLETPAVTGNATGGYVATLRVGVPV